MKAARMHIAALFSLGVAITMSPSSANAQAASCSATAKADSFTYKDGEIAPQFKVTVTGCTVQGASTGRLTYSARVVDRSNREDMLKNLDAKWVSREGASFTFGPSGVTRVPAGQVASVRELTEIKVIECGCVDK